MERFGLKVVAAPASEPLTVAEAKARLRITTGAEDADLTALITQARELCEAECQRAFVTQTLALYLDCFPRCDTIRVPRPPLQSVSWVKYYDAAGVQQTLDPAKYHVAPAGEPGRIVLKSESVWPEVQDGRPEAVEVQFVAGYGAASAVPAAAKAAILVVMAAARENPAGDDNILVRGGLPASARRLLNTLEFGEVR